MYAEENMSWKDTVFNELDRQQLFQSDGHRTRFKELTDCYADAPFFTPGLCKCMYLSSWDDEHFLVMLDMLNQLSLRPRMNLDDMEENGQLMAEESDNYDTYVLRLSCAFLDNSPFSLDCLPDTIDPKGRYIITEALKAAAIIDSVE